MQQLDAIDEGRAAELLRDVGLPMPERMLQADADTRLSLCDGESILIIAQGNLTITERSAGATRTILIAAPDSDITYVTSAAPGADATRDAILLADARLDWIDASVGSTASRSTSRLREPGASAKYRSVSLCGGDERYDARTTMIHDASHTSSKMLTRVALLERSTGTYRGLIDIAPGARGCDAYQHEDTLLLGDGSRMDAEPQLEIRNEDVKCSHGVTIGHVDDEQLFYLESRGIPRDEATALLVQGFFDQILISMGEHGVAMRDALLTRFHPGTLYANGRPAREDFPILQAAKGKRLVYLDSAASAQKPKQVIDGMARFYETSYANVHRGLYPLAEAATDRFEEARMKAARLLGAAREETIFTRGTTDALNMVARMLESTLKPGDEIAVTSMEHHSNFVPWQQIAKARGCEFKVIETTPDGTLDMDDALRKITARTRILAVCHASNVFGTINPVEQLARMAHDQGAVIVVDGAQAIPHIRVDVKALDVDFYAFSGHKLYGPEGIGVLYGKREQLERLPPPAWGGEMVADVRIERTTWNELPHKLEPGTPDITQAVGLGLAIDYLESVGRDRIRAHEHALAGYALAALRAIPELEILGPTEPEQRVGAISFVLAGVHPHDVAQVLAQEGIAVRAGHHCAQPLHCALGLPASTRASIGLYTTREDIDRLVIALRKAKEVFA